MIKKRTYLVYRTILSATIVIAGICLIVACVGIYNSGDQPFSREAVAAAFQGIAVPVYLCLALVVGGFILEGFFPPEKKKRTVGKQYTVILERLHSKLELDSCDPQLRSDILAEQSKRKRSSAIAFAILVLCSAIFLSYGLDSRNFHQSEINRSMIKAMALFLPCLAIPFIYGLFCIRLTKNSIKTEIELVRSAIGNSPDAPTKTIAPAKDHSKLLLALRWGLLCIAFGILFYGFFAGGTSDVLTKAINICTECVGLG